MSDSSITSFFKPAQPTVPTPSARSVPEISGLTIINNFVTSEEETKIITFLDTQEWRTDLKRRCIHYGGTYCLLHSPDSLIPAPPIPPPFYFLLEHFKCRHIYPAKLPQFCIVNEYIHDQGISAHVENFRFGSPVCGLSLNDRGLMRFHELVEEDDGSVRSGKSRLAERTGKSFDVWMERRSLVVMKGEARRKWQHEIVRTTRGRRQGWRRVSLTFRVDLSLP